MVRFHKLALGAAFVAALTIVPSSVGNVGFARAAEMTEDEKKAEESAANAAAEEMIAD
eukprot:CAMPEP_0172533412 /NCGR_PEP_ID=MMETSP1067-20121228/6133_1 /TAXON_ID=265564 ORGANISM="Thalassiosira punctigera, Strain Tpunct2005C2" /NCGR_SAMPLE_ID=MMETSP1067 /ASSEMBLY_ACC=CAM_ASM_000444 /LENGTH=57 /DNA_ID=CAMNT_0013318057 /DNA_START=65 /DNA_END=235 /DNA_ORIENTATION=+